MAAGESVAYLPGDVIVIARKAKNGRASTLSWGRVVPRQRASIRSDFQVFRESSLAALDRLQMPEHFFVLPRDVGDGETVIVVHDVGVMAFRFEQQVAMLPIEDLKKARAIGDGRVLIESESQGTLLIDYSRQSNFGTQEWSQLYTTQPLKAEKLIKHSGTN
jgi:hypothetical protein